MTPRRLWIAGAALAAGAPALAGPAAKAGRMRETFKPLRVAEAGISCEAPASWTRHRDPRGEARDKIYAVTLRGPRTPEGLPPLISLRYYAPGNPEFPDAASYLKRQAEPGMLAARDAKPAPTEDIPLGRDPARRVVRDSLEYYPPRSMKTREIPMREEHVALQSGKGFYALVYAAPRSVFDAQRPVFQRALDTFRASPPAPGRRPLH